jgi:hypothetical protein
VWCRVREGVYAPPTPPPSGEGLLTIFPEFFGTECRLIGGKVIGCHVSFVLAMKNDIEPNPNKKSIWGITPMWCASLVYLIYSLMRTHSSWPRFCSHDVFNDV